jgi:multidrug resistance efflux pump
VNDISARKPTAVRRYVVPLVLGALVLGALIILIGSFVRIGSFARSANASALPTPTAVPVALQATAVAPTPTPVQVASNRSGSAVGRVTGNLASASQASLAFQMSGRIQEYTVKEGDKVKQGAVLASIDTATIELQVAQAQAALTISQARLSQTKKGGTPDQVATANQALELAKANYAKVLAGPTADDLSGPKANLDRAQAALDQAQRAYDRAGGASNPYAGLLPTSLALQQATANYQAAVGAYNLAKNRPTPGELAGAGAQLAQAYSLAAQVNPTEETLTIAQAQVDQAQAALDLAKQTLANAKIVAPFDGTVVWIGPHVGENANTQSTAIVIADLTRMQVQANVDELTLAGLKVGQRATLNVDALGDKTLTGRVAKIGLFGTTAGGVVSVPVWIDVDPTDASVFPGLTATVQFESAQ